MKYGVLDVESTIYQNGHPYSDRNRLCLVGIRTANRNDIYDIEYSDTPYREQLNSIQNAINGLDLLVGFNCKFDLGWLLRYGIFLPHHVRIFDCQLAEFILTHQRTPFPDLASCLIKYGLAPKLDTIYTKYWSRGIDTPEVPFEELKEYLDRDLEVTDALYKTLLPLSKKFEPLIKLHMQDLRVLLEMEYNGIRLDWVAMEQKARETKEQLDGIESAIREFVPVDFQEEFNGNSNDHISLLLYGGELEFKSGIPYLHTYKSGDKAGTTETRNRWETIRVRFPRLVDPLENTGLAKEGFWSTGADVLSQLPKPKELINLLLKQAELSKLLDTYLLGFPLLVQKMDWQDGYMHSTLNQCVAVTGRLSSSKHNQQNLPEVMNEYIQSRF